MLLFFLKFLLKISFPDLSDSVYLGRFFMDKLINIVKPAEIKEIDALVAYTSKEVQDYHPKENPENVNDYKGYTQNQVYDDNIFNQKEMKRDDGEELSKNIYSYIDSLDIDNEDAPSFLVTKLGQQKNEKYNTDKIIVQNVNQDEAVNGDQVVIPQGTKFSDALLDKITYTMPDGEEVVLGDAYAQNPVEYYPYANDRVANWLYQAGVIDEIIPDANYVDLINSLDEDLELDLPEVAVYIEPKKANSGTSSKAEPTPVPTAEPTSVPTAEPTSVPTAEPTPVPTAEPTVVPTAEPTAEPTVAPTATPTAEPTIVPTAEPTIVPTAVPTAKPTPVPTAEPTVAPTAVPTAEPTVVPTAEPTVAPTVVPTAKPTPVPTAAPTAEPTVVPTAEPTVKPTVAPTAVPTAEPTPTPTQSESCGPEPTLRSTPTPTPTSTPTPTQEETSGNGSDVSVF